MKIKSKGFFTPVLIIIAVVLVVIGGAYIYKKNKDATNKLLGSHYKIESNQVYFNDSVEYGGKGWLTVSDADPKTFEVIFDKDKNSISYSKDANYVFINNKVLKDANPKTFKISDSKSLPGIENLPSYLGIATITQDDSHVFMCWGKVSASLNKFKFLGNVFATNGDVVYNLAHGCDVLKNIDPLSFKQIDGDRMYKDKNGVYAHFDGVEIDETDKLTVDAGTFENLVYTFAKDRRHVYTINLPPDAKIVEGVAADGFKYLGSFYFKNNQKVYRIVYHGCAKDNCSYYNLKEVAGADASSFQLVGVNKDNQKSENYNNDRIGGVSTIVDAKDRNNSYANGNIF